MTHLVRCHGNSMFGNEMWTVYGKAQIERQLSHWRFHWRHLFNLLVCVWCSIDVSPPSFCFTPAIHLHLAFLSITYPILLHYLSSFIANSSIQLSDCFSYIDLFKYRSLFLPTELLPKGNGHLMTDCGPTSSQATCIARTNLQQLQTNNGDTNCNHLYGRNRCKVPWHGVECRFAFSHHQAILSFSRVPLV